MGTRRDGWKDYELIILRDNYPFMSAKRVAQLLPGRSPDAIAVKAYVLKLKREPRQHFAWPKKPRLSLFQQRLLGVCRDHHPIVFSASYYCFSAQ